MTTLGVRNDNGWGMGGGALGEKISCWLHEVSTHVEAPPPGPTRAFFSPFCTIRTRLEERFGGVNCH